MGVLQLSSPLEGCSTLTPPFNPNTTTIALIKRSGPNATQCTFVEKVQNAQLAGYAAVIVFDYEDEGLVIMGGSSNGVGIPSVFVTQASGQLLMSAQGNALVAITSSGFPGFYFGASYFFTAACFIAAGIMIVLFYACCRRRTFNRGEVVVYPPTQAAPMDVSALPSRVWTASKFNQVDRLSAFSSQTADDAETCCVCLSEYTVKDTVTTLPCNHIFHKECIEPWLTQRSR